MKEGVSNLQVRKRLLETFMIFTFFFLVLMVRLFWIQFLKSEEYLNKAQNQWTRSLIVQPQRGQIFDRNGQLLAGSASAETIVVIPSMVRDAEKKRPGLIDEMAVNLAAILDMEVETVKDRLTRNASQVYLKRKVEDEVALKVVELNYPGIRTTVESKRFYPNGNLASHILGFVGIDEGLEGIEFQYENELKGKPGNIVYQSDARGREIPGGIQQYIPPQDGLDIVLTIDSRIQNIIERELTKAMINHAPLSAAAIAVNPHTGEILGMASMPNFDPGNYGLYPQSNWRNPLITSSFEPGSTFKIITLAAGLEENVFSIYDTYYCDGYYEVAGRKLGCWTRYRGGHGLQTFIEVTENSCNPGFIELGMRLGKEKLFQYIHGFGFGKRTGIDLPGEQTGILFDINSRYFSLVDLGVSAFGQGNAVTPIQQIMAVSAVVNGGTLMKPYIAKEFYDQDGQLVKENKPTAIRRVISEETSKELVHILESVVINGSGKFGAVPGYRIGGKTGTAQKISPTGGYLPGKFILSFIGFAPVEDPQVVLYVMVDEPSIGPQWGSQVAAPIFRNIMGDILKVLNVKPNNAEIEQEPPKLGIIPNLRNQTIDEAIGTLQISGFNLQIEGEGEYIIAQTPKAGIQMPINSTVIVYTSNSQTADFEEVTVPDLKGKSLKEVKDLLGLLNLQVEIKGSGIAVDQRPKAGEKVKANTTIVVEFAPLVR
ncbi:stage V sporulation protein D [Anaerobranca gottschalkii]|uniref:Stage V sporulation protein D (Sporulation-specific penicillin-binding protein) n=1 Tax=Anaerobranca gottschalkii DSM 13577 TaxID=1120990 RepID=A0A1H9YWG5_9FIRM|nr:stage V sporulation protein D [Anaerobranca gottschalkii]SES73032.1 stage V sporulation protein D (sporulation-specific penicillin-binding protein) [Anaerobranca gottschalkii DSM 13577]